MAPRVLISYSHDSDEHAQRVLALANRLRADGIDCRIDQYLAKGPPEGWPLWMDEELERAEAVLVVFTERYAEKAREKKRSGVKFESVLILQELYDEGMLNEKFISVVFDPSDAKHIVKWLRPYEYYHVGDERGCEKLRRRLADDPEVIMPPLGPVLKKGPRQQAAPSAPGSGSVEGTAVAQAAAMTFVDVMRLLYIHGSKAAAVNVSRYGKFMQRASHHFGTLNRDFARFNSSLSPPLREASVRIDRRLSSMIADLGDEAWSARHVEELFRKAKELSALIDEFAASAAPREHSAATALLNSVLEQRVPDFEERIPTMTRDDIFRVRLSIQTPLLQGKRSISEDDDFAFALSYFVLDRALLSRMN